MHLKISAKCQPFCWSLNMLTGSIDGTNVSNQLYHGEWCLYNTETWWRHQMETFYASLALCEGNPPVTGGFPAQRPMTSSDDVFFDLCLNKRLNKQSRSWWFEMPSHSLWRHYNVFSQKLWGVLFVNSRSDLYFAHVTVMLYLIEYCIRPFYNSKTLNKLWPLWRIMLAHS